MENYFPDVTGSSSDARERVVDDLRQLALDAETLLNATVGDMSGMAGEARDRLKAGLERAKVTIAELQRKGVASARAAAISADETIRARPYESVAVAFGIGLLAGLWLNRR